MAIHLYRSNRTENLVDALCEVLKASAPADPFQEYPIVIGSRGMERWIKHEIATRTGMAARLAFPFPRPAFEGAARWLLDENRTADARFWERDDNEDDILNAERMAFRIVDLIREYHADPDFARVVHYLELDGTQGAVGSKELVFAESVAGVLSTLLVDRGEDTLVWARDPKQVPEQNRWLAHLLHRLGAAEVEDSPPMLIQRLGKKRPASVTRSLCVFGLSTMSPGDRAQLRAISTFMDVHLFIMTPTDKWVVDDMARREYVRALKKAKNSEERAAIDAAHKLANPILFNLGLPSRDLQSWLESGDYEESGLAQFQSTAGVTSLERIQNSVLDAKEAPIADIGDGEGSSDAGGPRDSEDLSLEFHRTYGAMRQCEVLRDRLLDLFAGDPTLEPRDILVMTPDIQTYAPLVTAVFSRRPRISETDDKKMPEIPVAVADLGLRQTNPIAAALLDMVALSGERLKASWVVDFMSLDPVRRRFGLGDDLSALQSLLQKSGFRWGVDAEDRTNVGQPALDQNTARFAMERMALGVLMPDEDKSGPTVPSTEALGPASALDIKGRDQTHYVGQLSALLRSIIWHRKALRTPATPSEWRERFSKALDDLTATSSKAHWLRVEVNQALDDLVTYSNISTDKASTVEVDRQAIETWLGGRFDIRRKGDRPITGAVQVCAMEPMRSVPFKVVALLGMDDGSFPRGSRRPTWDPMDQTRKAGERDRREVDRHLLLEAILSARDKLMVFWTGFDVKKGDEKPAAVPIEELLEVIKKRNLPVHERAHALQPWSTEYFQGKNASFDHSLCRAADKVQEIRAGRSEPKHIGLTASTEELLPERTVEEQRLDLEALAKWLVTPQQQLLKERLGISLYSDDAVLSDREPVTLDNLETWTLRNALLGARRLDSEVEASTQAVSRMQDRLRGEGGLPLQSGGETLLEKVDEQANATIENLHALPHALGAGVDLSLVMENGLQLYGRVERVRVRNGRQLLEWYTASSVANERARMNAWVHLLAATATGHPVDGARLVGYLSTKGDHAPGLFLRAPSSAGEAKRILQDLVSVRDRALRSPVRLFKQTSLAFAESLKNQEVSDDGQKAMREHEKSVTTAWLGTSHGRGDVSSEAISTFFADFEPWQHLDETDEWSFSALTRRVWMPLVEAGHANEDEPELAAIWNTYGGAE
ncbi:MAG: exodeoxyribonuclease V subunit gamma [Myxococcota bacterium]|nr:exodeoxyribonuclease V subunit gamma [Myxococcota bacterium]